MPLPPSYMYPAKVTDLLLPTLTYLYVVPQAAESPHSYSGAAYSVRRNEVLVEFVEDDVLPNAHLFSMLAQSFH